MRDEQRELAIKIPGTFTVAAVGDLIQMQPFTAYAEPATRALLEVMRSADVTVANLEVIIIDEDRYRGPEGDIVAPKSVADDIVQMGVKMVTKANNHAFDLGEEGFWECLRQAERVGIVHCGAGRTLKEARKPRYFASGKGLVGMCGIYVSQPQRIGADKLPSVNTLQVETVTTVTPDEFAKLQEILEHWKERAVSVEHPASFEPKRLGELEFLGKRIRKSEQSGRFVHEMNEGDLAQILLSLKTGKQFSDFLIASFHWHENRFAYQKYTFDHYPAEYQIEMAHRAIDAGADMVVGHGVHTIKGIEIYKGRPICYGLSNFVFQQQIAPYSWTPAGTVRPWGDLNAERFRWLSGRANLEALLVQGVFSDGKLSSLRIYPVDLGPERVGSRLGIPQLAAGPVADDILRRVREYSKPFGTEIRIENGIGVVAPA